MFLRLAAHITRQSTNHSQCENGQHIGSSLCLKLESQAAIRVWGSGCCQGLSSECSCPVVNLVLRLWLVWQAIWYQSQSSVCANFQCPYPAQCHAYIFPQFGAQIVARLIAQSQASARTQFVARLIAQSQASARTQFVASKIVTFVYGIKKHSVTKVSTQSQPVVSSNNMRRVLI